MITRQTLEKYLASLDLQYSRFNEKDSWLILLDIAANQFYMTIELHEDWFALTVNPLVEDPEPASIARLSYHICRLNRDVVMAKFFIDDEADVGLVVELPRKAVDETVLKTTIQMISQYIEKEYEELVQLSQDLEAPSKYLISE
jgi:hypothetical protein